MASCYIYGVHIPRNMGYRRRVNTGYSVGASYGKRLIPSIRSHYGLRTVCENCAVEIDDSERTANVIGCAIIAVVGFFIAFVILVGSLLN
jgi:hypothetical protein